MMKKTNDVLSNAPSEETYSVNTEMNTRHPYQKQHNDPGKSVNEHKNLEEANIFVNQGEIGQQRENN